jgi:glycosyltransferase involved in cell wall biosynthesis
MLVTDVGGLAELIPDGKVGYAVKPTAKAIVDALVNFYEQHREAEFAAGVQEQKKLFSWSEMVRALKEVAEL